MEKMTEHQIVAILKEAEAGFTRQQPRTIYPLLPHQPERLSGKADR
ncbi:hypothetical protein [Gilliamella sp. Pas-s27]|nr:hypothetical protein [Gilliamella sp. Pas-s27]